MNFIFGSRLDLSRLQLPDGLIGYRLKERNTEYAQIFLKFQNRIEQRYLQIDEAGNIFPSEVLVAINYRSTTENNNG